MRRFTTYKSCATIALAAAFISCGKKSTNQPASDAVVDIPVEETPSEAAVPAYDIDFAPREGSPCADLGDFYAKLSSLPHDAWVRRYTASLNVDDKHPDNSRPRANFLTLLAFRSFNVNETRPFQMQMEGFKVEQTGCQQITFTDNEGLTSEFEVRSSTPTSLKISAVQKTGDPAAELRDITYEWSNPRQLTISTRYNAFDECSAKTLPVELKEHLRWGPAEMLETTDVEEMSADYLEKITHALVSIPSDLATLESASNDADEDGMLSVSIASLKRLKNESVRRDLQNCPYRAKAPAGDEPPPPEPGEAPAPVPAPEGRRGESQDSQSQPTRDSQTQPSPDSQSQPDPDSQSQPETETQPAPDSQTQPSPETQTQPAPDSQAQPTRESQSQPAPEAQTQPAPDSQAQPSPETQTQPAPDSQSQPTPAES